MLLVIDSGNTQIQTFSVPIIFQIGNSKGTEIGQYWPLYIQEYLSPNIVVIY